MRTATSFTVSPKRLAPVIAAKATLERNHRPIDAVGNGLAGDASEIERAPCVHRSPSTDVEAGTNIGTMPCEI